jgi:hypothetical protein
LGADLSRFLTFCPHDLRCPACPFRLCHRRPGHRAHDLGERSYPIRIAAGLLGDAATYAALPKAASALIVTNTTVAPLYLQQVRAALAGRYPQVHVVELPDGEAYKDWQTLNLIFDALLQHGCDRKTVLFALGGGVIGRHDRLCRCQLYARRAVCAGAHHAAGPGGFQRAAKPPSTTRWART